MDKQIEGCCKADKCCKQTIEKSVEKRIKTQEFYLAVANVIIKDLRKLFPPNWVIHLIGSVSTGLASASSDVDLCIIQDSSCYTKDPDYAEIIQNLENIVYSLLISQGINGELFKLTEFVYNARVPILRLYHLPSTTKMDLVSMNGLIVEGNKLVRQYLDSDERVRWLVLYVLQWTEEEGVLGKAPKFRTFALTWLVLYYLMQTSPPVVCSVSDFYDTTAPKSMAGFECGFKNKLPETTNHQTKDQLLFEFLLFLVTADFVNNVVCPLTGCLIPKENFELPYLLPPLFEPYKKIIESDKKCRIKINRAICIQDPIDLCHNISKQVTEDVLAVLVHSSLQVLKESSTS